MQSYRDLAKELTRLQSMAMRLATIVKNPSMDEAEAVVAIANKTKEVAELLNARIVKHLHYTQPRRGTVEAPVGRIGKAKHDKHDPEPAIEQVPTT